MRAGYHTGPNAVLLLQTQTHDTHTRAHTQTHTKALSLSLSLSPSTVPLISHLRSGGIIASLLWYFHASVSLFLQVTFLLVLFAHIWPRR